MDRNKVRYYIKEYFTFTKSEQVGIIAIIAVILLIISITNVLPYIHPQHNYFDVSQFEREIVKFEKVVDSISEKKQYKPILKDTIHPPTKRKEAKSSSGKYSSVEINSADSAALEQLPGIGPVLARRIVRYRTLLGGYYSLTQLNEVYGIKQDVLHKMIGLITIDTSSIRKIDINTAGFKEINSHPYISYDQTKAIFEHRKYSNIHNTNQLVDSAIFTTEEMRKLKPYLIVDK